MNAISIRSQVYKHLCKDIYPVALVVFSWSLPIILWNKSLGKTKSALLFICFCLHSSTKEKKTITLFLKNSKRILLLRYTRGVSGLKRTLQPLPDFQQAILIDQGGRGRELWGKASYLLTFLWAVIKDMNRNRFTESKSDGQNQF